MIFDLLSAETRSREPALRSRTIVSGNQYGFDGPAGLGFLEGFPGLPKGKMLTQALDVHGPGCDQIDGARIV